MFKGYLQLGLEHILDPNGIDHVLFLIALVILFDIRQWKQVLILATAFTIGHSLTLALAASGTIPVNVKWIEILIAASIGITAFMNLIVSEVGSSQKLRYLSALIFGLIHGMGFSNFFKTILGDESLVLPLLAFNIGVEVAQVIVVLAVLLITYIFVRLGVKKKYLILFSSMMILIWSIKLIVERI